MAALTPDQIKRLGPPPKPPGPQVLIANKDGKPNEAWFNYTTRLHEWQLRLIAILGE